MHVLTPLVARMRERLQRAAASSRADVPVIKSPEIDVTLRHLLPPVQPLGRVVRCYAADPNRIVATFYAGEDLATTGITIHLRESEIAQWHSTTEIEIAARLERLHCLP